MTSDTLITINIGALIAVATAGFALVWRMSRMSFQVEMMWTDFRRRFPHARSTDDQHTDEG